MKERALFLAAQGADSLGLVFEELVLQLVCPLSLDVHTLQDGSRLLCLLRQRSEVGGLVQGACLSEGGSCRRGGSRKRCGDQIIYVLL